MSFILFSDSSCNLPCDMIAQHDVRIVPLSYNIAEETYSCYEEGVPFDSKGFFDRLRAGALARTSLINTDTFLRAFEPILRDGRDIVYISISSGISGTYQSAVLAAEELNARYAAQVYPVDSLSASLGEGFMVLRAAQMRDAGANARPWRNGCGKTAFPCATFLQWMIWASSSGAAGFLQWQRRSVRC